MLGNLKYWIVLLVIVGVGTGAWSAVNAYNSAIEDAANWESLYREQAATNASQASQIQTIRKERDALEEWHIETQQELNSLSARKSKYYREWQQTLSELRSRGERNESEKCLDLDTPAAFDAGLFQSGGDTGDGDSSDLPSDAG